MPDVQTWPTAKGAGGPALGDYSQAVLATPGLQSYWPLGDAGASSKDYGPIAVNASFSGRRRTDVSIMGAGHVAADDKASLYRDYPDTVDCQTVDPTLYQFTGTKPFTIEAVVLGDAAGFGGYRAIAGRTAAWVGGQVWFMGWSNQQLCMARSNGAGYDYNVGTHWTQGVKHHVAWTYNGSLMRAYIDGVLDFTVTSVRSIPSSALPFRICSNAGISSPTINAEKIAVYNVAVPVATLLAHAALI